MLETFVSVDKILDIFEEAHKYNYSESLLRYDLSTYLHNIETELEENFNKELEIATEDREDEIRDECYSDAFDEGKGEGISEGKYNLLRQLLVKVKELKHNIKKQDIKPEEIQQALTKLITDLDSDGELDADIGIMLNEFGEE